MIPRSVSTKHADSNNCSCPILWYPPGLPNAQVILPYKHLREVMRTMPYTSPKYLGYPASDIEIRSCLCKFVVHFRSRNESPNNFSLWDRNSTAAGICKIITYMTCSRHDFTLLDDNFSSCTHGYKNPTQVDILLQYLTKHVVFSTPIHHLRVTSLLSKALGSITGRVMIDYL